MTKRIACRHQRQSDRGRGRMRPVLRKGSIAMGPDVAFESFKPHGTHRACTIAICLFNRGAGRSTSSESREHAKNGHHEGMRERRDKCSSP